MNINNAASTLGMNSSLTQGSSLPVYLPTPVPRFNTVSSLNQIHLQQLQQQHQQQANFSASTTPLPLQFSSSNFGLPNFNIPYTAQLQSVSTLQPLSNVFLDSSQFSGFHVSPNSYTSSFTSRENSANPLFSPSLQTPHPFNHLQFGLESPTPLYLSSNHSNFIKAEQSTLPLRLPVSTGQSNNSTLSSFSTLSSPSHLQNIKPQFGNAPTSVLKPEPINSNSNSHQFLTPNPPSDENRALNSATASAEARRTHQETSASIRRDKHKQVEIRRRKKINNLFAQLSDELDCGPTDKASILAAALNYIRRSKQSGVPINVSQQYATAENPSLSPAQTSSDAKSD
jgi:hypothetical protein